VKENQIKKEKRENKPKQEINKESTKRQMTNKTN
jgi:hypothetical protein